MKVITKVTHTRKFIKQLERVPSHIKEKVKFWVFNVGLHGLREIAKIKGYHDEPLLGERWGQRSVRLNKSYRLIYRIIQDEVHIELLEVHKHDY
ncbi:type II toxin-antitoxin system RelE/ParE family toxin [Bdellovibrio bacteriovorus]|uniref:type II toxin-antitoxin system RelE family toxin n=1 Tax=Bdellovibrio TaxID=958 RepID=UPI0035A8DDC6